MNVRKKVDNIIERDNLTGVYKRSFLTDRLEREFTRAKRCGRPLSCIMLEVSNLEELFLKYGPEFGDYIIKEVADILKKSLREEDCVFRYDANKFFVVLPETKMEDSFVLTERLRYKIENINYKINHPSLPASEITEKVSLNIGLSSYPNEKIGSSKELIQMSDEFIQKSKKTQVDRVIN